jgi:hypothetical protein
MVWPDDSSGVACIPGGVSPSGLDAGAPPDEVSTGPVDPCGWVWVGLRVLSALCPPSRCLGPSWLVPCVAPISAPISGCFWLCARITVDTVASAAPAAIGKLVNFIAVFLCSNTGFEYRAAGNCTETYRQVPCSLYRRALPGRPRRPVSRFSTAIGRCGSRFSWFNHNAPCGAV